MSALDSLLFNVSQLCGTTLPRIIALLAGLIMLFMSISSLWERRLKALPAFIWIVVSSLLIIFAINTDVLHQIVGAAYLTKIRMMIGLVSAAVLVVTLESIRRSHLQERYAILWVATGIIIFLCALFPWVLEYINSMFGIQHVTSVVAVVFVFLVLVAFHFSISMSDFSGNQSKISQRVAILEAKLMEMQARLDAIDGGNKGTVSAEIAPEKPVDPKIPAAQERSRGSRLIVMSLVIASFLGIVSVGVMTGNVMIGDEVTHYYMLVKQSADLSVPNFCAYIPTEYGGANVRLYPHTFAWHYAGAVVFKYLGQSIATVQVYQGLFFVQLLLAALLLARSRGGMGDKSAIVYLFTLASIPMAVIFSVAFYQDVPMTAQVLTAFYLLSVRRTVFSMPFMLMAILMKESAILFLPVYVFLMLIWDVRFKSWIRAGINLSIFALLVLALIGTMQGIMRKYADSDYYPNAMFKKLVSACATPSAKEKVAESVPSTSQKSGAKAGGTASIKDVTLYEVEIIANHPGDLRDIKNYFIYGGLLMWLVVAIGITGRLTAGCTCATAPCARPSSGWLWGVGLFYLIVCGVLIRSAPDARFFLPALPFILLPLCENVVRLKRRREIVAVIAALAILQFGEVLAKSFVLRNVPASLVQGIDYLKQNKPPYNRVFMYPEGNYRLFPCSHEWYLGYKLRDFWKGNNDTRIKMLSDYHVGAIVIKKHLIAAVDEKITNLGVYPDYFVRDLQNDSRFNRVFDNSAVSIYTFPIAGKP